MFKEVNTFSLKSKWVSTPLGSMLAIADEEKLYLLEFEERRGLEHEIERLRFKTKISIIPGKTAPLESIENEVNLYFEGKLKDFKTPYCLLGSPFQQLVWQTLLTVSYGETNSYREQAIKMNKQKAFRAVANANGANQLAILIPCHRIITSNGKIGGYGGGIDRKKWLIEHEKRYV